jgi:hypothetical protein
MEIQVIDIRNPDSSFSYKESNHSYSCIDGVITVYKQQPPENGAYKGKEIPVFVCSIRDFFIIID